MSPAAKKHWSNSCSNETLQIGIMSGQNRLNLVGINQIQVAILCHTHLLNIDVKRNKWDLSPSCATWVCLKIGNPEIHWSSWSLFELPVVGHGANASTYNIVDYIFHHIPLDLPIQWFVLSHQVHLLVKSYYVGSFHPTISTITSPHLLVKSQYFSSLVFGIISHHIPIK
jgi:hypothetical protein